MVRAKPFLMISRLACGGKSAFPSYNGSETTMNHRVDPHQTPQQIFYGLSSADTAILPELRPIMARLLPGIIDELYRLIGQTTDLAPVFGSHDKIPRLKQAQINHWTRMLDARMDADYIASARAVGQAHHRIGLSADWYIRGYGFVLRRALILLAAEGHGLRVLPRRRVKIGQMQSLLSALCLADMELALSSYWDALTNEQHRIVEATLERIDTQASDVAGESGEGITC